MDTYKLIVEVQGADANSKQLSQQQGNIEPSETENVVKQGKSKPTQVDKLQEQIKKDRIDTGKKVLGGATAVGYIGLDLYQQDLGFSGDSNRNTRINEDKKALGVLGTTTGLILTGNGLGAALFVGYTALNVAKENRELINTMQVDSYVSNYYQERLVADVTKRSR